MGQLLSKKVGTQAIIYSGGPFFGYPWKPILNALFGGDYLESYKHFREQHMVPSNLLYHCFCLVWQLSSNYAFLGSIDEKLEKDGYIQRNTRLMATLTSLLWSWHLLRTSPTPLSVKVASILSIYFAHNTLGKWFTKNWESIVFYQGFLEAAAFQIFSGRVQSSKYFGYLAVRTALWKYLSAKKGCLKEYATPLSATLMGLIAFNSTRPNPIAPVISMGFYGWIISLLTNNKNIYFWSCGMTATLAQGVAHAISREAGTLVVLQGSGMDMSQYELSHVTYFPNLLFQAIHEHFKL
jgi:hypothetical protein